MRADVGDQELLFVPARPWPFDGERQVAIEPAPSRQGSMSPWRSPALAGEPAS